MMDSADFNHWRQIRDKKTYEKKKIQEKNKTIGQRIKSPAYSKEEKEIHRKDRDRNIEEIKKLTDEIQEINSRMSSKCPTEEQPSDRLCLDTCLHEIERDEKWQDVDSEVLYRVRIKNADFSLHYEQITEENESLRQWNFELYWHSEKLKEILEKLQTEKEFCMAKLQLKDWEISALRIRVGDLKYENDLLWDKVQRSAKKICYLNWRLSDLSIRLTMTVVPKKVKQEDDTKVEKLHRKVHNLESELNKTNADYAYLTSVSIPKLQRERDDNKLQIVALENRLKNRNKGMLLELPGKSQQTIIYKKNDEISHLKDRIKSLEVENDTLSTLLEEKELQLKTSETKKESLRVENDSLKASSIEVLSTFWQTRRTLRVMESDNKMMSQRVTDLESRNKDLEEKLHTTESRFQVNKAALDREIDNLQTRSMHLERQAEESNRTLSDNNNEIRRLQSDIKEKCTLEDNLRGNIAEIEKKNKELQQKLKEKSDSVRQLGNFYKREAESSKLNMTDLDKKIHKLQEEKDKLLQKEETEIEKAKKLQRELDAANRETGKFLLRTSELERQLTKVQKNYEYISEENRRLEEDMKRLKTDVAKQRLLYTEEKEAERKQGSDKRDQELIRLQRSEEFYKKEAETFKERLDNLQECFNQLQEDKVKLQENGEIERTKAEKLHSELHDERGRKRKLQNKVNELQQRFIKATPNVEPKMDEENIRLKEESENLRTEVYESKQKILESDEKMRRYKTQIETLQMEKKQVTAEKESALSRIAENDQSVRHYMRQVETLQREKTQAIAEKENALTRLSALAGDRLRDNNAAIADLSDENRPINLGEKFSELYDNQWTDAIEKLEKLMTERDAIQKLLTMIQEIYYVCKSLAKEQLDQIAKAFGLEERKEKLKRLKDFRKSMAPDNLQDIKERVNSCVSKDFCQEAAYCESYINRSVELCWYMCIQDPPVVLEFKASHGDVFNDKIYRHFTKSGRTIDYMVWPVMYLHSNGPLLQKGVVQPV